MVLAIVSLGHSQNDIALCFAVLAFDERREHVLETLDVLKEEAKPLLDLIEDPETQRIVEEGRFTLESIEEMFGIGPDVVDALYKYAKFQYECGNYSGSKDYLTYYR